MKEIIFNIILVSITFLIVYKCYKTSTTIVLYTVKTKYKLYKILHKYYNLFFIILFIISLFSFAFIYFYHTNNVEKRFDNALKSYEQSLSNIFNNLSMETNNYTNESIVPNTSSSCTRDRISINNNNIMNMSEGDSFDELEKSFEIGLDLLKASLSEIMKNSNDVLTFWFAFLSVIMVVFTFAGILINNNVLEQSKYQLTILKKEIDIKKDEIEKEFNNFKKEQFVKIDDDIKIKLQNIKAEVLDYVTSIKNEYNKEFEAQSKKLNDDVANILEDNKTIVEKEHNDLIQRLKSKSNELEKKYNDAIENISLKSDYEYNKYIRISQLFNLGEDSGRNKDYNSVIKYNLEIITLYGDIDDVKDKNHINNYAGAYYNIGKAKSDLGCQDEAIDYLNKSINLNPNFSNAYVYRGIAYYQLGKYKDALKDYNKAIDLDENNDYAYTNRGLVKEALIEFGEDSISIDDIILDYNKAIKLKPNDFSSYINRARIKEDIKDYKGAIEDYNKAIELNIKDYRIYFNRYIDKELLLINIVDKNSEEYKKAFDDAYNDLDKAYNLSDDQFKEIIKEKIIGMAKQGNEVAKKFCDDKDWEIKI